MPDSGSRNSRVLMVIDRFYPEVGGAERQALLLSQTISKLGFIINVLTINNKKLTKKSVVNGISVMRIKIYGWYFVRTIWLISVFVYYLVKLRHSYDIIHVHGAKHASFASIIAAKMLGKKTLVKITNSGERFDLKLLSDRWFGGWMSALIIKNTYIFIALTKAIKQELINWGVDEYRTRLIPNGVLVKNLKNTSTTTKKKQGQKVIGLCVASLSHKKNHATLLKAMAKMKRLNEFELVLLGEGDLLNTLLEDIDRYDLSGKVKLMGAVSDVDSHYKQADLFVLVSKTEGLSNSVLEALSHGLPCLVSDIPGNKELVVDKMNGFKIYPLSVDEIADKMDLLVSDQLLRNRMGSQSIEICKQYSIDNVAEAYVQVYQNLINSQ